MKRFTNKDILVRNYLLLAMVVLLGSSRCWAADDDKRTMVNLTIRLREGSGDAVHSHYTLKYELPEKEQKGLALTNESGDIPEGRYSRVLGRRSIPYGVLCELRAQRRSPSLVELDAVISVLGPPVQILDEGKVFADQSMRVPLDMVPGHSVKIDLPRDWFVRTLNAGKLKTKDGPIWIELTVNPVQSIDKDNAAPKAGN